MGSCINLSNPALSTYETKITVGPTSQDHYEAHMMHWFSLITQQMFFSFSEIGSRGGNHHREQKRRKMRDCTHCISSPLIPGSLVSPTSSGNPSPETALVRVPRDLLWNPTNIFSQHHLTPFRSCPFLIKPLPLLTVSPLSFPCYLPTAYLPGPLQCRPSPILSVRFSQRVYPNK